MIKSVAIELTDKAFLPEAYAYRERIQELGYRCDFVYKGSKKAFEFDAIILFHGFHPLWKRYPNYIIGEYHSLSVGKFSRLKDLLKRLLNVRSDFLIFLNDDVRRRMWYSNSSPHAIRGMGFERRDFERYHSNEKNYDIVYCGSFREGLIPHLEGLAGLGLKIAVVGFDSRYISNNIKSFGRKTPSETRRIICQSRFGLNYTPDVFPLNIQDSTKVIEYCGAGLGVITNRYFWVNEFEKSRNARFMNLDNIETRDDLDKFDFVVPDISDLTWDLVVENTIASLVKRFG